MPAPASIFKASSDSLQTKNMKRVQFLVSEFMAGRPENYLAGCSDDIKGSVLGGLIPGAEDIKSKTDMADMLGSIEKYMEVKKFEPCNWHAIGDDVLFNVNWEFVWKETGKSVETTALVRKVVKDNMICEKYHMVDVPAITGGKPPHSEVNVERVKELLVGITTGKPEIYMAGVSDDIKGSVLGGFIPGGVDIKTKAEFMGLEMDKYMEVKKFEPCNYRALPNDDIMFNVNWEFVWKETGKVVETTAVVRKVLRDGMICEKYHMVDAAAIA